MPSSLLPTQIPPITVKPITGNQTFEKTWWLFFYNLAQNALGNTGTTAQAEYAQLTADLDADVDVADIYPVSRRVTNLEKNPWDQLPDQADVRALLLAQDGLLQDPVPRAQPVISVTPGASPWTYQALFDGSAVISGGTVSAVSLSRDGVTFYSVPQGQVSMSRLDYVKVTYSVAPTFVYFPR